VPQVQFTPAESFVGDVTKVQKNGVFTVHFQVCVQTVVVTTVVPEFPTDGIARTVEAQWKSSSDYASQANCR
jgi:hypothetical protein